MIIISGSRHLFILVFQVYSYWRVSPLEFFIWVAAVLVTIFSSIENGIYTSISASLALLLLRVARPRGAFLGKVTVRASSESTVDRDVYLPLTKDGITNPYVKVEAPLPGVLIYKFEESYLYPNSYIVYSAIVDYVKANLRRGKDMSNVKLGDRPWNDPGPRRPGDYESEQSANLKKPILHAVVFDFSAVYDSDLLSCTIFLSLLQISHRYYCCPSAHRYPH